MSQPSPSESSRVAVVGGGPAGLMAAETLAARGVSVELFDAMPSVGRKFLLAGKGGLNLTHSEAPEPFLRRYGAAAPALSPHLDTFGAQALQDWAHALGITTFVGSSGRVFPTDMKAAPLLRAWLQRLRAAGVRFSMRHRWTGFAPARAHTLNFDTPAGPVSRHFEAVVLALGGGSWARLGSDGAWVPRLASRGVPIAPLKPSNCGFHVAPAWSDHLRTRHAGDPLKAVALSVGDDFRQVGEFVLTDTGIEGSLVYAASSFLRDRIARDGAATLHLDLLPTHTAERVAAEVAHPRGSRSLSSHLKSRLGLHGVKVGLLHEVLDKAAMADPARLAATIKALPLMVDATRPIDEAISTAGGVRFDGLDAGLGLRSVPGVFCAGEMLDWEAPTGGYLLTACFATGRSAGGATADWLGRA